MNEIQTRERTSKAWPSSPYVFVNNIVRTRRSIPWPQVSPSSLGSKPEEACFAKLPLYFDTSLEDGTPMQIPPCKARSIVMLLDNGKRWSAFSSLLVTSFRPTLSLVSGDDDSFWSPFLWWMPTNHLRRSPLVPLSFQSLLSVHVVLYLVILFLTLPISLVLADTLPPLDSLAQ